MEVNIQSEFQDFKNELKKLGIEVQKIVKVGNGSMDFHEVFYKSPKYDEVKSVFVQRHGLDELLKKFKEQYN
ncbi:MULTISPECIES: hypothetical protein [Amniculibacterium]|jgi:hypothetical protein|uniref:hypothetical protein n=1 Tax=Amniculibacterium TaxID=2715289 RepID=UPI000F5B866D|nr:MULTISPECIES: hypothetical protein [Amniculibacterium]